MKIEKSKLRQDSRLLFENSKNYFTIVNSYHTFHMYHISPIIIIILKYFYVTKFHKSKMKKKKISRSFFEYEQFYSKFLHYSKMPEKKIFSVL